MSFFDTPVAYASTGGLNELIGLADTIVGKLIPIAIALAVFFFFWGLAIFIYKSDSEEEQKKGRQRMIWGIIALFVIVSVWGLVRFIGNSLGIGGADNSTPPLPQVPTK